MFRDLCPELLDEDQLRAWTLFEQLGLPDKRGEYYRQIPLGQLYGFALERGLSTKASCRSDAPYSLLFVNGHFRADLSRLPDEVVVTTLSEGRRKYAAFLKGREAQWMKEEEDPFAALNGALHGEGAFLYLPPGRIIEEPIELLFAQQGGEGALFAAPRLHLFLGANSSLRLVSTLRGEGTSWINRFIDCVLEKGARLEYSPRLTGSPSTWLFDALRGVVKQDAHLRVAGVVEGLAVARSDYHVALSGEGAGVELMGAALLDNEERLHTQITVDHRAPHCNSRQLFKGVLAGHSRSTFNGKILVQSEAQQTDAFQLNNNLLLSNEAVAHSQPNLEIFADDVKASHGATVGQIDKELLHYLRSRGIGPEVARSMLVRGFVGEVTDAISYTPERF